VYGPKLRSVAQKVQRPCIDTVASVYAGLACSCVSSHKNLVGGIKYSLEKLKREPTCLILSRLCEYEDIFGFFPQTLMVLQRYCSQRQEFGLKLYQDTMAWWKSTFGIEEQLCTGSALAVRAQGVEADDLAKRLSDEMVLRCTCLRTAQDKLAPVVEHLCRSLQLLPTCRRAIVCMAFLKNTARFPTLDEIAGLLRWKATPRLDRLKPEPAPACFSCAMCQEEGKTGESVIRLPSCGHAFHASDCLGPGMNIFSWLQKSRQCPVCKQTIYIT
jgi:hypothetical protein